MTDLHNYTIYKTQFAFSVVSVPMIYRVCRTEDVKENSMMLFRINKMDVLIGRKNGKLFACNNSCPHRGASLSKGELNGENIVCYMHGYEYNVFNGKLEHMKSWKKDEAWMEQSPEWRKSGNLTLYEVIEKGRIIYVEL